MLMPSVTSSTASSACTKGGFLAGAIEMVPFGDLCLELRSLRHREPPLLEIKGSTPGALAHRGRQKHLQIRVRKYCGADIPALSHQATFSPHGLLLSGEPLANRAVSRHRRHGRRHLRGSDRFAHIHTIHQHQLTGSRLRLQL